MAKYIVRNKRLAKYLYSLGFERESSYIDKKEVWIFNRTENLHESLNFYFYMRKKNR